MRDGFVKVAARTPEVIDSTAVARHDALESPLVAQDTLQQTAAAAAGGAIEALVGAHHLAYLALYDKLLEGGQIGLPEVALGQSTLNS